MNVCYRRTHRFCVFAAAATALVIAPGKTWGQANTQRGATLGGITGAIAGAIIGENNNEAGAGAAIGGVVGVVAGGLLGNARDKELRAQQQYYAAPRSFATQPTYLQPTYTQQNVYAAPLPQGAVSFNDVVAMTRSGVSEGVILNQIQSRGVLIQPQVSDIISLHQQGVSELVISAMQRASVGEQIVARPTYVTPAPVVVQPHVYEYTPVYRGPVYRGRPPYHYHPRYGY